MALTIRRSGGGMSELDVHSTDCTTHNCSRFEGSRALVCPVRDPSTPIFKSGAELLQLQLCVTQSDYRRAQWLTTIINFGLGFKDAQLEMH